ncbi:Uncharacterised protein [Mycobacteroides abscessus subsp. abscessus]|nr:Uncharacterised protein [Mycobacteroides abscessus subsp. abscessus]SLC78913.1 Uncharacterised protein [Mycobacteroides abscessus subsp. abscessus]
MSYEMDDRVYLLRNPAATGTVVGFDGVAPVVEWDVNAAPGDPEFLLRGQAATMSGSIIRKLQS